MTNNTTTTNTYFDTKAEAIRYAKSVRAAGGTAKVYRESGTYTEPFKGITSFARYFVAAN